MAITTLRPDSTNSGAGNLTITGDSATVHAALSDNSDATYVRKSAAINGTSEAVIGFGTTTIGASEVVKRVRLRVRYSTPTSSGKMNFSVGIGSRGFSYSSPSAIRGLAASPTDYTGPWFTSAPDGQTWDQIRLDSLKIRFNEYRDGSDRGYVYELYLDVDKEQQPTVSVVNPTGTVTTTAAPTVEWTYTDPDAGTQAYYQVKIYSQAQYSAGGFSADTSTATWDSGEIASSSSSVQTGSLLLNGTYRAYVRAAKVVNNTPFWSAWAYSGFVLNLTPPTTPTLTGSWSAENGKTTISLTGANPVGYTSQYFQIQRSDDGGVTFADIRNGSTATPNASYKASVDDYEAKRGMTVYYRARAVGVSGDNLIPTAWTANQQILVTNDAKWWMKAVTNPALNTSGVRIQKEISIKVEEPNTVFRPIGRSRAVVVAGKIQGEDGSYDIVTTTEAEWTALVAILKHQGTILIQDPYGDQKYVRFTERNWDMFAPTSSRVRSVTAAYVEVDG